MMTLKRGISLNTEGPPHQLIFQKLIQASLRASWSWPKRGRLLWCLWLCLETPLKRRQRNWLAYGRAVSSMQTMMCKGKQFICSWEILVAGAEPHISFSFWKSLFFAVLNCCTLTCLTSFRPLWEYCGQVYKALVYVWTSHLLNCQHLPLYASRWKSWLLQ